MHRLITLLITSIFICTILQPIHAEDLYDNLFLSIQSGNIENIESYLSYSLDLEKTDAYGCTVLTYALAQKNFKIAEMLLQKGADINHIFSNGTTLLHWAAYNNDYEILEFLLNNKADHTIVDKGGRNILHYAAMDRSENNFLNSDNIFLKARIILMQNNQHKEDTSAEKNDNTEKSTINSEGHNNEANKPSIKPLEKTPLIYAVSHNNITVLKKVLDNKNSKEISTDALQQALQLAQYLKEDNIIFELNVALDAKKPSEENEETTEEETTTEKAGESNQDATRDDATFIPMYNIELVHLILKKGVPIDAKDTFGYTGLHRAVKNNNLALCKYLIEEGADINGITKERKLTPLLIAMHNNNTEIASLLIDNGANINVVEKEYVPATIAPAQSAPYKRPESYNFKFIAQSSEYSDPKKDRRSFYKIFIDQIETGRTSTALESQKKSFKTMLSHNRHLIRVEQYIVDEKKGRYVKLNNIDQPKTNFIYVEIPEDKILLLYLECKPENRTSRLFIDYEKEKIE